MSENASARQDRIDQLSKSIVELARRWYRYGNEAELASAVQEYESMIREQDPA